MELSRRGLDKTLQFCDYLIFGMKVKKGIYEHYKGKRYEVIGVAKNSETLEEFVVYKALYKNKVSELWIRPLAIFLERVELKGKRVPRFRYVGN